MVREEDAKAPRRGGAQVDANGSAIKVILPPRTEQAGAAPPDLLDKQVAAILRAPGNASVPLPIRELEGIRSAAMRIIEDESLTVGQRAAKLIRLAFGPAREAQLRYWAERVVHEELMHWLEPDAPSLPPVGERQAAGALRRAGYSRCPICVQPVLSEMELDRYRRLEADFYHQATTRRNIPRVQP